MRPRAVVLFARSPWREAAAKGLRGETAALFRKLIAAWIHAAVAAGAQVIVACEDADRDGLSSIARNVDRLTLTQRGESFGERLANAADDAFAHGYEQVIVAGIDAPPPDLDGVFRLLDQHRVVAAPSTDGGVNLIGLSMPAHELLASIEVGVRCSDAFPLILDRVTDIDSPEDLLRATRELAWAGYFETTETSKRYIVPAAPIASRRTPSRAPPAA
ncbi:MAG TPA: DUF2064 domain-containing protein [Thermoanaerobaculia bacterium]|jgi:glycosyltransferase A (GT-A) superfamily protein (DUF2064 family)|nr:DUF2064 domain-containing protein [Thermoanaerobaculia bacterium]